MKPTCGSKNFVTPKNPPKNPVVALGVFDGVHRGHCHIFKQVVERARELGGTGVVYTFDPHPVKVLVPEAAPPMINTLAQRIELISHEGIQRVVVEKFTKSFARQTPEIFFEGTIVRRLKARELFVGYDFTFGVHRSGTIDHLQAFARRAKIGIRIVEPYLWKETLVSSTRIRQLLAHGQVQKAEDLLDRPYFIEGKVVSGRGIGGPRLGIHTANLLSENDLLLPTGVYVTTASVSGRKFQGVTNIGPNPTFGTGPISIESHLLDFHQSAFGKGIRGKRIRIEFLEKIREEITFASAEDLATQIRNDIRVAKRHFAKRDTKRDK